MEPEGLLPCSKNPASGPYSEPHESIPHLPNLPTYESFEYYLSIYFQIFLVVSSFQDFQPKYYMRFSSLPRVIHRPSHPPSFDHSYNI